MFILVSMQLRSFTDAQPVKRFKRLKAMRHVSDIKSGMLQAHENEISERKWSGGTANFRTLEGALSFRIHIFTVLLKYFVIREEKIPELHKNRIYV